MPHEVMVQVVGAADQTHAAAVVQDALKQYGCQARVETVYRVEVTELPPFLPTQPRTGAAEAIAAAFRHGLQVNAEHVLGFYRQRPAGSQWGRHIPSSVLAWSCGVDWREVPHDQLPTGAGKSFCRYFKTNDPALLDGAVEHVALSTQIPRGEIQSTQGEHGWQLVTRLPVPKASATEAWLVLGPAGPKDPELIPWTAFPGRMAAAPPPGWDGDLSKLDLEETPYGVKFQPPESPGVATLPE